MPAPTIKGYRTQVGTGNSISVEPPAGLANGDTLVAIVQTPNQTITWPAGWTEIQAAGTGTPGAAASPRLSVAIRQVTTSSSGDWWLNLDTTGYDHCFIVYVLLSGCVVNASDVQVNSAGHVHLTPGISTTQADALVLSVGGHAVDVNWTCYENWTNGDLSGFGKVVEYTRPEGVGGGIGLFSGGKATAGSVGASTLTMYDASETNIPSVGVTIALVEPPPRQYATPAIGAVQTAAAGASSSIVAFPSFSGTAGKYRLEVLALGWRGNVAPTVDTSYWTLAIQRNTGNTTNNNAGSISSGAIWFHIDAADATTPTNAQRTVSKAAGSSRGQFRLAVWETAAELELDVASAATESSGVTTASLTGLAPTAANDLVIVAPIGARNVTLTSLVASVGATTPSGATNTETPPLDDIWLERLENSNATSPTQGLALADVVKTTAGSLGTITAQFSTGAARHSILGAAFRSKSSPPAASPRTYSYLIAA